MSLLEVTHDAPSIDQYTSIEEHQAQTPGTFFGGKPVLHYHSLGAQLSIERDALENNAAFSGLRSAAAHSEGHINGNSATEQIRIPNIDVWVTSEHLILFSPSTSTGVQIPYPSISLHAQQAHALYMQLSLSDISQTADEDLETLELLLTPSTPAPSESTTSSDPVEPSGPQIPSQALYAAVSACADLHPDPDSDDEQEDLAAQMPGAGGWITSENMHEYMDDEGNLRIPDGGLGAGAGSVRPADEFEDADDGAEEDGEETKWRRTG